MKKFLAFFLFSTFLFAQNLTDYVNPFVGTAGHGHTFPGAVVPFGMVQLSPDTYNRGWDWCSGYHYSDSSIMGFSHTHLSGTGAADYGDILFMPTMGKVHFSPGGRENPDEGYRSRFEHEREKASPGYYSVYLDDYKIQVELTATVHTGFQKYTVEHDGNLNLIIDLVHGISDNVTQGYAKILGSNVIEGYRKSTGWARNHTVHFYTRFSKPFTSFEFFDGEKVLHAKELKNDSVKVLLVFPMKKGETLLVQTGISFVSIEGARENLEVELNTWDFEKVCEQAKHSWEKELERIKVEGNERYKRTFYTAFYHTMIHPNIFNDVNGKFIGADGKVHYSSGNVYTVFSLWDTFRALHPLFTLIDKKRTADFVNTMLLFYKYGGHLPVWELSANETWTMIGYHSVPVIADAYLKDVRKFDDSLAYVAMLESANSAREGVKFYREMGYCPMDSVTEAVSKTVEYAYDDWCIAQFSKALGKLKIYREFLQRAQNYYNVFDKRVGFLRGRKFNGLWREDFDPADASPFGAGEFTEGNSWQYTFFMPQNIDGLIESLGGEKAFESKLDSFFTLKIKDKNKIVADMSGLIGQYAHGNEPSHHIAYLYDYSGQAWKTQKMVRKILTELYSDEPNGLPGNEDCGQMSAWYVFSAMGFYPVTPASDYYAVGAPLFEKVIIKLENGKRIVIRAENASEKKPFVKSISVDGRKTRNAFLLYSQLKDGAKIDFTMSEHPDKNFGATKAERPISSINFPFVPAEKKILFQPFIDGENVMFARKRLIKLGCVSDSVRIRFTLDGTVPSENSKLFVEPFEISQPTVLTARAFKNNFPPSPLLRLKFEKEICRVPGEIWYRKNAVIYPDISLRNKFSPKYTGGSDYALIDGVLGGTDFHDGHWQGFQGKDLIAVVDLGKTTPLSSVGLRVLENQGSWIFFPREIRFYLSNDGKHYRSLPDYFSIPVKKRRDAKIRRFTVPVNTSARYVKVFAKNLGVCPPWHWGAGGKAWIFADEIIIKEK